MKRIEGHLHIVTTSGFFLLEGIRALWGDPQTHGGRGWGAYRGRVRTSEHGAERWAAERLAAWSMVDIAWRGRGRRPSGAGSSGQLS